MPFAALLLGLFPSPAGATPIEIRAGSSLQARLEQSDEGPVVRGRVTTERGEPIQAIVRIHAGGAPQEVPTDERGEFTVPLPPGAGPTHVRVELAEGARHEAAVFDATLSPALADVSLDLAAPARASLDAPTIELEVRGDCSAGFSGEEIVLSRDGRTIASPVVTDETGRARFRVGVDLLGPPGPARLEASFAGDAVRAPAIAHAETIFGISTFLDADASPRRIPADGETRVSGRLRTKRGPVAGGAIVVELAGTKAGRAQRVAVARTDTTGAFEALVSFADVEPSRLALVARYEPDAAWRSGSASRPIGVEVLEPVTVPVPAILVPSVALLAIAALLLSRLRAPRRRPVRAAAAPVAVAGAILRRHGRKSGPPADFEVTGRVWDPVVRRPVAGAAVQMRMPGGDREVVSDEDGAFASGPLPAGETVLSFSAPGYEPGTFAVQIPHAGELRDIRFQIVPIRQRLAEVFRDAVAPLAGDRRWGYATPRDLARAAIANRAQVWRDAPIELLRDLVERGAWGRVEPVLADLRRAREIAATLPARDPVLR